MADEIRRRFEKLERRTELPRDVTCFRPDGPLSSVNYIAHPHGLHVATWLRVLSHTQANVTIDTPAAVPFFSNGFVTTQSIIPSFIKVPKVLSYVLSGLILRFFRSGKPAGIVHAHSASGHGMVAWLSGQPYVLGTYGSEIFDADQRGALYCWLLRRILHGAKRIHNASPGSREILINRFQIPPEKIVDFHLGYDETCFHKVEQSKRRQMRAAAGIPVDQPLWVVCRRTHPHYRTTAVVAGFLDYCQQGGPGHLVLICGDQQHDYTRVVLDTIKDHPLSHRVTAIDKMLSLPEFASWLQMADFSISVPKTDNFSNAIWESLGCGAVPILTNLKSYDEVRSCKPIRWMDKFESQDFRQMFHETSQAVPGTIDADRDACLRFAQWRFSTEQAVRVLAAFYLGEPIPEPNSCQEAAKTAA